VYVKCYALLVAFMLMACPIGWATEQPVIYTLQGVQPGVSSQVIQPLYTAIQQALAPFLTAGDRVEVTLLNAALVSHLTGEWQFHSTLHQLWSPRFVMIGQQGEHHVGIPVKVTVKRQVWTALMPIAQGQAITPVLAHITVQPVQSGVQWLPASQALDGLVAKLLLQPGQPIDKKKVRQRMDIQAKQPVTADVESDDVLISVMAIADISGVKGQIIPITAGKKHYQAEIIGPNRVKVRL
jgi:flagella basal body P-ring formation protein FlgA